MKFIIEKNIFLAALSNVQSVVERRNTIPILSNILITVENGKVLLNATDMDLSISDSTTANVISEGSITTPAGTLFEVIKKMPDGCEVSLELKDTILVVEAGRSRFELLTLPIKDFPVMTGGDMPYSFEIGSQELCDLIERTRFAISTEETRYYLNGIYIHKIDGMIRVVATDGHRLAKADTPAPENMPDIPGVIIPRKTVAEIHKLLEQTDKDVTITLSETKIEFTIADATLTSKLVDGNFPDYSRVIPEGNPETFSVDCSLFHKAVDRVATVSDGKMRPIKLQIEDGIIRLLATHADMGTAQDEMETQYTGEPLEIGFNAKYLLDIATQMKNGTATFEVKDGASPSIIRNDADSSVLYVLMPMRV